MLSEAERTAALYSLLQESTQVQIRFFITVLQQMARNDPVGAFISPNPTNQAMSDQLEAKMAQLGIKSPSAMKTASPNSRAFQRQSTGFLSPNSASLYGSGSPDVSAALAAQRSKLKANRTSAPGVLPMDSMPSYTGNSTLENVQEKPRSTGSSNGTPRERPRSTEVFRSPRASGPLDDTLSPMSMGGSWASMVNTPIMSMLDNTNNSNHGSNSNRSSEDTNAKLEATAAQLAQLSQHVSAAQAENQEASRIMRGNQSASSNSAQGGMTSGPVYEQTGGASWSGNGAGNVATGASGGIPNTPANMMNSPHFGNFSIPTMSPNALAGLQSPSGGISNPANLQMMNTMAGMGGLNNMNSTQLLALQQQILQQQQQLSMAGFGTQGSRASNRSNNHRYAHAGGATGSMNSPPQTSRTMAGSPASSSTHVPPAQGEEEVADISVLNDVPSWLRHLRLHKYTPNFEGSNWREMVMMDDRALEEKGVAALGARRKMLKTFEAVRLKYGMEAPPNAQQSSGSTNEAHTPSEASATDTHA